MKFIRSTDIMKNLLLLSELEKGLPTTQAILSEFAGVSVAMVNSYIKKLCDNGFLTMHGNNKRKVYQITAEGIEYKRYLLVSFMAELIELSTQMSVQIKQMLLPLVKDGARRVYFYGAGETGQVCAKVAAEIPQLDIIGFIDDNPEVHNKMIAGYPVIPLTTALQQPFDKIVVSVFRDSNTLRQKLLSVIDERKIMSLSDMDINIFGKKGMTFSTKHESRKEAK